jgi:hypothetical protein
MATVLYTEDVKTPVMTAIQGQIDSGSGAGYFELYSGAVPTAVATAPNGTTQIKLGTLTFSDSCGTVTGGELICAPSPGIVQDASADADGTATWARVYNSDGVLKFICDISNTGGGGCIQLNSTAIKAGGPIICTSFKFTMP